MKKSILISASLLCIAFHHTLQAQGKTPPAPTESVKLEIGYFLTDCIRRHTSVTDIKIDSFAIEKKRLKLFANETLSYGRFDHALVDSIYAGIHSLLPPELKKYKTELYSDGYRIEDYIPLNRKERFAIKTALPLTKNLSAPYTVTKGLQNRHIALWHSHGWYYNGEKNRWEWQRARLFQTVEDVFPQSFVLPYLIPMLEKAGANVLTPRERDTQSHEIIVDNDRSDAQSAYSETAGSEAWTTGATAGFAHLKSLYADLENPFADGTYRQAKTISKGTESVCAWTPDIPENGRYGVYVSYSTLKNSARDARYTVYHTGGKTELSVNQTMNGGTWVFLGFFDFEKGCGRGKVVLTNRSGEKGRIVTADAVKIGGGMGNIARGEPFEPSGRPRWAEGSRYWLQWAGLPDSVYRWTKGERDYTDDYQSRGLWVNHLIRSGAPIDAVMAFHTDAGVTFNDSIIGTLGICMTHYNGEKFADGRPRILSRDLVSTIMDEIVNDVRAGFEPSWTRRHIWNRSYSEARLPEAPTMLLELLSHQNFADMRYGLDPEFRFAVSRAIYKGFLKFIAYQNGQEYVVAPLPVSSFGARFTGETQVRLEWEPVIDPAEPTAAPTQYIVYTAVGDDGFDNGRIASGTHANISIEKDRLYRFRVAAFNAGGESFPSETLSACRKSSEKGVALIVNGFTRLSAPASFASTDSLAGFLDFIDHGVDYGVQTNYIGSQYEFRREITWTDNDATGFGASNADREATLTAGNSFNYPFVHGKSIAAAGFSFISSSAAAVMNGRTAMDDYPIVDLILGKQKQTRSGRGAFPPRHKTFPPALRQRIADYCNAGGRIMVSGSFVGSDLWDSEQPRDDDKQFAQETLKFKWRTGHAAVAGRITSAASPFAPLTGKYSFYNSHNADCYAVESPDAIEPVGNGSHTVFRYSENYLSAAVAFSGSYKTCVLGFPFETVYDEAARNQLMRAILDFMSDGD